MIDDDRLEDRLRRAFAARAAEIDATVPPALVPTARPRATVLQHRRSRFTAAAAVAAAVVVVGLVAVALPRANDHASVTADAPPTVSVQPHAQPFDGIWPVSDRADLHRLQRRVDGGAETWRLDALSVAAAYLEDRGIRGEQLTWEPSDAHTGVVAYRTPGDIKDDRDRHSMQLARQHKDGIYYVTGSDSGWTLAPGESRVNPPARHGSPLRFTLYSYRPGGILVRAGAFSSEWAAESMESVTETELAGGDGYVELDVDLDIGDLPDALVVQVLHETPKGLVSLTELRLDSPAPSHESCGGHPVADPGADEALRRHLDGLIGTTHADTGETAAHFTVVGDAERTADRAVICVRAYWAGPDEAISALTEDRFVLTRSADGRWEVAERLTGRRTDLEDVRSVPVAFLVEDSDCGDRDSDYEFVDAGVAAGADSDHLLAVLELITGPLGPATASLRTTLPPHGRVHRVEVVDGTAVVDFTPAAQPPGGSCWVASVVGQIRRTLLAFPDVNEVVLQVDGHTRDVFQP